MSRGRVSRPKRPRNYPEECWRKVPFDYSIDPTYLRWICGKKPQAPKPPADDPHEVFDNTHLQDGQYSV